MGTWTGQTWASMPSGSTPGGGAADPTTWHTLDLTAQSATWDANGAKSVTWDTGSVDLTLSGYANATSDPTLDGDGLTIVGVGGEIYIEFLLADLIDGFSLKDRVTVWVACTDVPTTSTTSDVILAGFYDSTEGLDVQRRGASGTNTLRHRVILSGTTTQAVASDSGAITWLALDMQAGRKFTAYRLTSASSDRPALADMSAVNVPVSFGVSNSTTEPLGTAATRFRVTVDQPSGWTWVATQIVLAHTPAEVY